jgi:hypothetical protein
VLWAQERLIQAAVGSGAAGSGAVGSGAAGSGAVISGAAGSDAVSSGVAGSDAVSSGVAGSGAVGSGVAGSVPVGSGAVMSSLLVVMGRSFLEKPTRSRRIYGIIRNGRWNWNCKSRNRHAFPNFRGRLPSGLHWVASSPLNSAQVDWLGHGTLRRLLPSEDGALSAAISPQQARTAPSGRRPCRRGVKSSLQREPDVLGDLFRALFGNVAVELACRWHRTRNIAPTSEEAEAGPEGSARTASALAVAEAIMAVHRADGSGTTFIWTDYLSKVSDDWKSRVGASTAVEWPAGIGAKGNEGAANNVVQT